MIRDNAGMPMQLLTPEIIARLDGLEVKARTIVEGMLSGEHRGKHSGFSVDFAEHRVYTPGDDVRHVDWKVYGKRDRLYIRQFEEETRLKAWLVLDVSRSMTYCSRGTPLSKLQYASCLAAAIGWLVCQQRDALGLILFSGNKHQFWAPRSGLAGLREIYTLLEAPADHASLSLTEPLTDRRRGLPPGTRPADARGTDEWTGLHAAVERVTDHSVLFLFTDGFGNREKLLLALQRLRAKKCDSRLIQILDPAETTFPFDENTAFEGLETGEIRTVPARSIRTAYLEQLQSFLNGLERDVPARWCLYRRVETTEPLDHALLRILDRKG